MCCDSWGPEESDTTESSVHFCQCPAMLSGSSFLSQEFSAQGFENSGYECLQAGHALFTLPRSQPVLTDFYIFCSANDNIRVWDLGGKNSERITILKLGMIWPNGLL